MLGGGLNEHWYSESRSKTLASSICRNSRPRKIHRNLGIRDFTSVFLVLAFGFGLASLAFLIEKIHHFIKTKKTQILAVVNRNDP